jgi:hypothetical protein
MRAIAALLLCTLMAGAHALPARLSRWVQKDGAREGFQREAFFEARAGSLMTL